MTLSFLKLPKCLSFLIKSNHHITMGVKYDAKICLRKIGWYGDITMLSILYHSESNPIVPRFCHDEPSFGWCSSCNQQLPCFNMNWPSFLCVHAKWSGSIQENTVNLTDLLKFLLPRISCCSSSLDCMQWCILGHRSSLDSVRKLHF